MLNIIQLASLLTIIILSTVLITYHLTKGSDANKNTRPEAATSKTSGYKTKTMYNLARLGIKVNHGKTNYYVKKAR
ncbi:hypothetical protein [Listeria booriae]|uniref:Uncharacterized protein n=1 Tax=Listeria booriae TaxID=1552123 RepID=A0A841XYC8_9LIST|nr:hypothetical protein [Listeria booriae]MBC1233657.1 hypothetical protein [Listeria booriae]MBC1316618.1 hypothetical protein [Listeria booriae]